MSDKKIESNALVISDDNLSGNYIVEKAKPLSIMQNMPFTLGEFKILDTYLSRINARDPSRRTVRFRMDEYEKLTGVSRIRPERIEKTVDNMMRKIVTVADSKNPGKWNKFVLFSSSKCFKDEDKQWYIELKCSEEASTLFFELSETGYFKYYLSNVTSLNSIYSYYMYLYFLKNDFRGHWTEDIDSLRAALCCTAELYNDFRYFKNRILVKALKEVNEKTDVKYDFETVKNAQKVVAISFKKKSNNILPTDNTFALASDCTRDQKSHAELDAEAEEKYKNESVQFLATALNNEFDETEMLIICDVLVRLLPKPKYWDIDRYDYLQRKYLELNLREKNLQAKGDKINNRFGYFKSLIEADLD